MKGACPGEVSSSKAALPPRSLLPAPQLSTSQGHKFTQVASSQTASPQPAPSSTPCPETSCCLPSAALAPPRAAHCPRPGTDDKPHREGGEGTVALIRLHRNTHTHPTHNLRGVPHPPPKPAVRQNRAQLGAPTSHPCRRHSPGHGPIPGSPGRSRRSRGASRDAAHPSSPTFAERHGAGGGRAALGRLGSADVDAFS